MLVSEIPANIPSRKTEPPNHLLLKLAESFRHIDNELRRLGIVPANNPTTGNLFVFKTLPLGIGSNNLAPHRIMGASVVTEITCLFRVLQGDTVSEHGAIRVVDPEDPHLWR